MTYIIIGILGLFLGWLIGRRNKPKVEKTVYYEPAVNKLKIRTDEQFMM